MVAMTLLNGLNNWFGLFDVLPRVREQISRALLAPQLLLVLTAHILTPHLTGMFSTPLTQKLEKIKR